MLPKINPTTTEAWKALKAHYRKIKQVQMKDLFAEDSRRFNQLSFQFEDTLVCLLYTSPSPRDATLSRMPSSA